MKSPQIFEEALARLETPDSVDAKQRMPLEDALAAYQEGGNELVAMLKTSWRKSNKAAVLDAGELEGAGTLNRRMLKAWRQKPKRRPNCCWSVSCRLKTKGPHTLHEAMRYVTPRRRQRLRPLLLLAASELGDDQNAVEQAMAAIEMVHVYSLVHDDMPAMDNDSLRRRKTDRQCEIRRSHRPLGRRRAANPSLRRIEPSDRTAGRTPNRHVVHARQSIRQHLARGRTSHRPCQRRQSHESGAQLEQMHSLKTGAALIAPPPYWARLPHPDLDSDDVRTLDNYASKLGLAFQVIDDVLDCKPIPASGVNRRQRQRLKRRTKNGEDKGFEALCLR